MQAVTMKSRDGDEKRWIEYSTTLFGATPPLAYNLSAITTKKWFGNGVQQAKSVFTSFARKNVIALHLSMGIYGKLIQSRLSRWLG